jgi:HAD superfamily hydrolase (TIGR01509 family)
LRVKGVLFDLDGVVLKSMEQHLEAWRYAFEKYGINVKKEDLYQLEGRGSKSVAEELTKIYEIDISLAPQIMEEKIIYYDKIYKAELYDGLYDMLTYLSKNKIKTAIVTGASRDRVDRLVKSHLSGFFAVTVTSDDVQNTKPYAEPYLKGAKLLKLNAAECLVLENAPLGIRSAKKAGMRVIAIQSTLHSTHLKQADYIVNDMREAQAVIHDLINSNGRLPG